MSPGASVVLLASPGESTNIVYQALAAEIGVAHVILEEPVRRAELLKRRLARLGPRVVAGQILFQAGVVPLLRRRSRARIASIKRDAGLNDAEIPERFVSRVPSANAGGARELLRGLRPRVVVVNGTRILSKELLRCVDATFVNTHAGITPRYRGVHGGYWALANGDPQGCGVTVHLVDHGIDTGAILGQARISPTREDNFVTYPYLQIAAGLPLLVGSVRTLLAGPPAIVPSLAGESRLWSHPTLSEYIWGRVRRGVR